MQNNNACPFPANNKIPAAEKGFSLLKNKEHL